MNDISRDPRCAPISYRFTFRNKGIYRRKKVTLPWSFLLYLLLSTIINKVVLLEVNKWISEIIVIDTFLIYTFLNSGCYFVVFFSMLVVWQWLWPRVRFKFFINSTRKSPREDIIFSYTFKDSWFIETILTTCNIKTE